MTTVWLFHASGRHLKLVFRHLPINSPDPRAPAKNLILFCLQPRHTSKGLPIGREYSVLYFYQLVNKTLKKGF